jgi:hypothetical protein
MKEGEAARREVPFLAPYRKGAMLVIVPFLYYCN